MTSPTSSATSFEIAWDSAAAAGLPYLEQYFGAWAMEERAFRQTAEAARRLDLSAHLQTRGEEARAAARSGRSFQTADTIAVVPLRGTLMKQVGSLSAGTSTVQARRQIREAAADATIDGILLHIDSPGGTVAGADDLATDVRNAARRKPVDAFIEDLGASAAYLVASQANQVTVNPSGLVGSIGTFMVVEDLSGLAEELGVKVHVIRFGEFKGAGTAGTEVTEAQLAEFQRIVDGFGDQFVKAVSRGREMPVKQVRGLADGRVHFAREARDLGLIDAVDSFDAALRNLRNRARNNQTQASVPSEVAENTGDTMPESESTATTAAASEPRAATYDEIAAICGAEETAFICEQLAAKATAAQAREAWNDTLAERVRIRDAEIEKLKAERPAAASTTAAAGNGQSATDGLGAGTDGATAATADPVDAFESAVQDKVNAGMERRDAVRHVAIHDKELHSAYLEAANSR